MNHIKTFSCNSNYPSRIDEQFEVWRKKMKSLEYKHRIAWFITWYYESGMEYPILLETMKDYNLDALEWYDEVINIPTELPIYKFEVYDDYCKYWEKKLLNQKKDENK